LRIGLLIRQKQINVHFTYFKICYIYVWVSVPDHYSFRLLEPINEKNSGQVPPWMTHSVKRPLTRSDISEALYAAETGMLTATLGLHMANLAVVVVPQTNKLGPVTKLC